MKYYPFKEGTTGYGGCYIPNTPYREDYPGVKLWTYTYPNDWTLIKFKYGK